MSKENTLSVPPAIRRAVAQIYLRTGCVEIDLYRPLTQPTDGAQTPIRVNLEPLSAPTDVQRRLLDMTADVLGPARPEWIVAQGALTSFAELVAARLGVGYGAPSTDHPELRVVVLAPNTQAAATEKAASLGRLAMVHVGNDRAEVSAMTTLRDIVDTAYLSGYIDTVTRAGLEGYLADPLNWAAPLGRAANRVD